MDVRAGAGHEGFGCHIAFIPRGVFGEFSKVEEEWAELLDARRQGIALMDPQEFSDLPGAVRGHLSAHRPGIGLDDLVRMAAATSRDFAAGERAAR